jgi:hypothetical protein
VVIYEPIKPSRDNAWNKKYLISVGFSGKGKAIPLQALRVPGV